MPSIHSFAVTDSYAILCIWPLTIQPLSMITSSDFAGISAMDWLGDSRNTTLMVFDLASEDQDAEPLTMEIPAMYANHHINAWEEGDAITMDLVSYEDASFLTDLHGFGNLEVMKNSTARNALKALEPTLTRYSVDLHLGDATVTKIPIYDDATGLVVNGEMPRFNDEYHGAGYCYYYAMTGLAGDEISTARLSKVDLCNGTRIPSSIPPTSARAISWYIEGLYPAEPIFVPRPGATDEDDGVVLVVALDGARELSSIVVINASDMTTIAVSDTPVVAPYDVHGQFFQ